ncbi:MAG: urease accessory UreF family protein [Pirellulales bacterium]
MSEDQKEWASWRVWQVMDTAFPTGSFAHSGGLEAAIKWREVVSLTDVVSYVKDALRNTARSQLPLLRATYLDFDRFEQIDAETDAFLSNHVANAASRSQGRALLATTAAVFRTKRLRRLQQKSLHGEIVGHQSPVLGVVAEQLEIPLNVAIRQFVFSSLRDMLSAAVRLNAVGPIQAQIVIDHLRGDCERIVRECGDLEVDQKAQTAPLLDMLQASHQRIYSKLFQS